MVKKSFKIQQKRFIIITQPMVQLGKELDNGDLQIQELRRIQEETD